MQVLQGLHEGRDPRLLVGPETMDDAGVYQLSEDLALVQTVDFFPPLVDDPFQYGRIAAANALSDVYAMGGTPLTALQIVGFPKDEVPLEILAEILRGGAAAVAESGALVVGGHSVVDQEIKYGLAVTGTVHPARYVANAGARPGDLLYLTKPLGMGAVTTAHKKEKVAAEVVEQACAVMGRLNRDAAAAMLEAEAHAATDITGYGFLGHAAEIARASHVTLELWSAKAPVLSGALDLVRRGLLSGGAARTREFLAGQVTFESGVERALQDLLADAETSGGLLIAVAPERAGTLEEGLRRRDVPVHAVGRVLKESGVLLRVL